MKSLQTKLCVLALVAAFPLAVSAAETGQPGQHNQMVKNSTVHHGSSQDDMGMMRRHMSSRPYSDRMFLSAMIPHHEGALVMALAVMKDGKDPQIRKWAEDVICSQTSEISAMQEWLKAMGGQEPESAATMSNAMRSMMSSPMNADPDINFVAMMIKHHVGALKMATVSLEKSNDQNVLNLSKAILKAQANEICVYKRWLLESNR